MTPEPKAPRKTASQRQAERMAHRHDAWRSAHALLDPVLWAEGLTPYDVLQLAQWLAGDATD